LQLDDLDLTQGLLALLNEPDSAVPETSASLPGDELPSAAAAADSDARREAIRRVASAPSGPDELPACSVRRSSSGLAVSILRSNSGGINTPKVEHLAVCSAVIVAERVAQPLCSQHSADQYCSALWSPVQCSASPPASS
jgi:hypothetical protein